MEQEINQPSLMLVKEVSEILGTSIPNIYKKLKDLSPELDEHVFNHKEGKMIDAEGIKIIANSLKHDVILPFTVGSGGKTSTKKGGASIKKGESLAKKEEASAKNEASSIKDWATNPGKHEQVTPENTSSNNGGQAFEQSELLKFLQDELDKKDDIIKNLLDERITEGQRKDEKSQRRDEESQRRDDQISELIKANLALTETISNEQKLHLLTQQSLIELEQKSNEGDEAKTEKKGFFKKLFKSGNE